MAVVRESIPVFILILVLNCTILVFTQPENEPLTPPYFNLAQEQDIEATATCGVGVSSAELFCKLTGATSEYINHRVNTDGVQIVEGQNCDVCVQPSQGGSIASNREHPARFAIDGTERWWQSPPLSRDMKYNEVNLTINLGQEFHVAYIFIKMANSPRPGVWALERSQDFGKTFRPWQYFADTRSDCIKFFNIPADQEITDDDTVICTTQFSKIVPLENGEIVVSLVNNRPSATNFTFAEKLQSWTQATNVRLRMLRTKTLLGHLMAVARQDPTVTRRYFYSIKDISLGGRCVCNGHAKSCDRDSRNPRILTCKCRHNTCGEQCDICCPGYVQNLWMPAKVGKPFICEPCQCYGHTNECLYDAEVDRLHQSIDIHGNYLGGGVCQNCRDNTEGVNCDKCVAGYYRPFGIDKAAVDACRPCVCDLKYSTGDCEEGTGRCKCRPEYTGLDCDQCNIGYYGYPDCIPCDCNFYGTEDHICTVNGGQCPCKQNYDGQQCDMCLLGFYNFPDCIPCQCDSVGSRQNVCDVTTGECKCEANFAGSNCDRCADGYYNFPACTLCDCDPNGAQPEICDKDTGVCLCQDNFLSPRCDSCLPSFYRYPVCEACLCNTVGSYNEVCDYVSGQCSCGGNFAGLRCEHCAAGYYRYPDCKPCNCDPYGSMRQSCDQITGQCECRATFEGQTCNKCRENFYNFPVCEECNCNPAGAKEVPGYPLGGCGQVPVGQLCECKDNVFGHICDQCKPGYYELDRNNPLGCRPCECNIPGTASGLHVCDPGTGQCVCKVDVVGQRCDVCKDGFHHLNEENPFGCIACNCDMGGSVSHVCNKANGQCNCKPRVQGVRCDRPTDLHFIPSLHQFIYEIEDGYTPDGSRIRYGFDESLFPAFSWRGYAILNYVQPEVILDLTITKPSLYRIIYRYLNKNDKTVTGEVMLKPTSVINTPQNSEVVFPPNESPDFVTVGSVGTQYDFVLDPGQWMISLKSSENVMLDYMVLIPQAYYEATVLQQEVTRPCSIPNDDGPCILYNYTDIQQFPTVLGENGFVIDVDGNEVPTNVFTDKIILNELGLNALGQLDKNQRDLHLNLAVPNPGKYVLVLNYFTFANYSQNLDVDIKTADEDTNGNVVIYRCQYSVLCRQVITNDNGMPLVVHIDDMADIILRGDEDVDVAIGSITAIPYNLWSHGYVRPNIICIRINGICISSRYFIPVGSVRIDFEEPPNEHLQVDQSNLPQGVYNIDPNIGLVRLDENVPDITIEGMIRNPGRFVFVVHFYMPGEVGIDIPVTIYSDGQVFTGVFRPRFCPTTSGCRGLITFDDDLRNKIIGGSDGKIRISFNNTSGRTIWMDYVLVIPARSFSVTDLNLQPIDHSLEFLTECIGPGFQVINNSSFCRDGVFTLTTDFNNGAVPCQCDIDGSLSFKCSQYGGQCQCRQNVIGRKCSRCEEGFYGFPRCTKCDCPFGTCHPVTGNCICPPNVQGAKCDECKPATYGYDALVGCTECNCNIDGVNNGDLNCDQNTGQCNCHGNIVDRKCDRCQLGYHTFPICEQCSCNEVGTVETICDSMSGQCLCKTNVAPPYCDRCQPGSYNLDPMNPRGCTQCFCFGTTRTCQSGSLYWDEVQDMTGWGVTNAVDGSLREAGTIIAVLDAVNKTIKSDQPMYWVAPAPYLGNKITSYGGKLKFQTIYMLPRDDPTVSEPMTDIFMNVLIMGHNMTIFHFFTTVPQPSTMFSYELVISENKFHDVATGLSITREQLMDILISVDAIHIAANHYSNPGEVRLMEVRLEQAAATGAGDQAVSVEECQCPVGYTGTSCESCEAGFYRIKSTPYLGTCVPCQCNGHADSCDPLTGACLNCRDNTMGDHCDQCFPGHYGDPAIEPCQICSCPLPVASNNFATSCDVYSGRLLSCDCTEGYTGTYCERCDSGYYGNPNQEGSTCERCQCSGNIDMNDLYGCDIETGECLRCLNNTTGPQCSQCKEWWYGDAVSAKNCRACQCDQCGSDFCDRTDGQCTCKPNVIGPGCEQCAPNTFGFDDCLGCTECNCEVASVSGQCDQVTGHCTCQPGVEGKYCDRCIEGWWNYGINGCQKCNCEFDGAITCDRQTGRCQCLPGVTGPTCDRCLDRWVLIPQQGCQECDNCVHILIDDVEALNAEMSGLTANLEGVSAGVSAHNRLQKINESVFEYRPLVAELYADSRNVELTPLRQELTVNLEEMTNTGNGKASTLVITGEAVQEESSRLYDSAVETESMTNEGRQISLETVQYIENVLERILQGIKLTNISSYVIISEQIMEEILSRNFSMDNDECNAEKMAAVTLTFSLRGYLVKADTSDNLYKIVHEAVEKISERLYDLQDKSRNSVLTSEEALNTADDVSTVLMASLQKIIDDIKVRGVDTGTVNIESRFLIEKALLALQETKNWTRDLEEMSTKMDSAIVSLGDHTNNLKMGIAMAEGPVNQTIDHADDLEDQAKFLESIYTDSRETSSNAIKAAQAYGDIVMAINDAYTAANSAVNASDDALMKTNGAGESSSLSKNESVRLLDDAKKRMDTTERELASRLLDAKMETDRVKDLNDRVSDALFDVRSDLPYGNVGQRAEDARKRAADSEMKAIDAQNKINYILNKLPQDKDKIQQLATDTVKTNKDTNDAMEQTNYVSNNIPEIERLVNVLGEKKTAMQGLKDTVIAGIAELKEKIKLARDEANRIRVGLEFLGNTTVTLRNPVNIDEAGSYTRLSIYIQTTQRDALLAYVGGDHSPGRPLTPDYLSLELRNGQPVFKFNLGPSGPAEIVHPWDVSDGDWYNIIAERTGKVGTLTLRKQDPLGQVQEEKRTGESPGTFTVLELDQDSSRFYVGGVPSTANLPPGVSDIFYEGIMEEVVFDERPMGLWNFVDGENNYVGALERNKLTRVISNGYRFDGQGYVTLSAKAIGFRPNREGDLILKFKTFAENGLLLYMGKVRDFISLELRDGRVFFQYDLGGMPAKLMTNNTYNDGEWHTIQAQRIERDGYLKVDGDTGVSGVSPGNLKELSYEDSIFIGGYNELMMPVKYVQSIGFDGCIKDVQFDTEKWDLNKNTRALGVVPACPDKIRRTANFGNVGHVSVVTDSIGVNFDVTFKMKTLSNNSLLLYAGNNAKTEVFSMSLVNGRIVVTSDPGGDLTRLESRDNKYNNGQWHYLSLMKMGKKLMMNIDDREMVNKTSKGDDSVVTTEQMLYFGGYDGAAPDTLVGSVRPFIGCIADVTVNGKFLNFASIPNQNLRGATFSDCPAGGDKIVVPPVTTPSPRTTPSGVGPTEAPKCALPNPTSLAAPEDMGEGTFFGKSPHSYMEYTNLPHLLRVKLSFTVRLKTTSGNGVIFYASDVKHIDFVSLYMKEGKVLFSFDCGTGEAVISSSKKYNDGQWHSVKFVRKLKQGALEIDGEQIMDGDGLSSGSARSLNVRPPYYMGGMPEDVGKIAAKNLMGVVTSFQGCIDDMLLNGDQFPPASLENAVIPCYKDYEEGSFFYNNGGYVKMEDVFTVGNDITLSLEVRPRSLTGVLLAVHADNGGDFLLLQMVNGELIFTADNGGGEFSTKYTPQASNDLCDSQWHKIEATKAKNTLLLKVDGQDVPHGEGKAGSSSADTKNPLYIGGVPDFERDGMLADSNLIGCLRNLMINEKPRYISSGVAYGDVNLDACPIN